MKTREEVLKEIQWQIDEYCFLRQLFYGEVISESDFFRDAGECLHRIYALLWVLGSVEDLGRPDLTSSHVVDLALALLDNANITKSNEG